MRYIKFSAFLLLGLLGLPACRSKKEDNQAEQAKQLQLQTIYGDFTITEPILIELIEHPMFERLKKVRQYGVQYYVIKPEEYQRHEHSIGTFLILRRFGASLEEQIAGLLHDVSHTVFSHVGDWVFDHPDGKNSYQDDNHVVFLERSGLADILANHGFTIEDIHHKSKRFKAIDSELPTLNADRIEYNLQGGLREKMITEDECKAMLDDLHFDNGVWYFTNPVLARKFADITLYHTEYVWTGAHESLICDLAAKAIKNAVKAGCLTYDDIYFGTDDLIWQRLVACPDKQVQADMHKLTHHYELYKHVDVKDADIIIKVKCRGVDPLIKQGDTLKRLSEIDQGFKQTHDALHARIAPGWGLKELK